jgi:protoporphyrinogen oxidase
MSTIVIGAGPAGLTAAYELSKNGHPSTILEADPLRVGGLSQTATYKDYRFDIGGHRFFSKNKEIEDLWTLILQDDMIDVPRMSRILYQGKYYDYPLKATNALKNLGIIEAARCILSYFYARVFPKKPISFEDWVTNQFGYRLFSIFFKTYTEKVWGMSCKDITADWAAQRIKGLSLWTAALNSLGIKTGGGETIKTLIDTFRYPRLGPGQMWEKILDVVVKQGCEIKLDSPVQGIHWNSAGVTEVVSKGKSLPCASVISSMPLRQLVECLSPAAPEPVLRAARGLRYRDYLTVVLIVKDNKPFPDNWIYIHDPSVKVGRVQNYKNWSKEMVPDLSTTGLGLEYFCFEGDGMWTTSDSDLIEFAIKELTQLGLAVPSDVVDGTVVRMPKAYPIYDETYKANVDIIREFIERELPNLQVVGRNGMHRYNNQDHAMLTGMFAARNLLKLGHYNLWNVNGDAEYLEEDQSAPYKEARMVPRKL